MSIRSSGPIATFPLPSSGRRTASLELLRAAVDLGCVPPVGLGVDEGAVRVRVARGARHRHRVGRPVVARRAGHREAARRVRAVAEPVAGLELQPRRGEHVERGGGDHLRSTRQQPRADQPGVGGEDALRVLRHGVGERHVAPEPGLRHAHGGCGQVVVRPVHRARHQVARRRLRWQRRHRCGVVGVEEVVLTQVVPNAHDQRERDRGREPVPAPPAVDRLGQPRVEVVRQAPRGPRDGSRCGSGGCVVDDGLVDQVGGGARRGGSGHRRAPSRRRRGCTTREPVSGRLDTPRDRRGAAARQRGRAPSMRAASVLVNRAGSIARIAPTTTLSPVDRAATEPMPLARIRAPSVTALSISATSSQV